MMPPVKLDLSALTASLPERLEVFICSASFESRCLSIPEQIPPERVGRALICANENFPEVVANSGKSLSARYGEKGALVMLSTDDPLKTADALQGAIQMARGGASTNYFIDITTFTHEAVLILLKILRLQLRPDDTATFAYTSALEYSIGDDPEDKWLSKGIGEIRSVLGYPGKFVPTRRLHLVILAGFEFERAERLIEEYEPSRISLGVGDPTKSISPDHHSVNKVNHARICAKYPEVLEFTFSCSDPHETMRDLDNHIKKVPAHNVLVAPMNTKISTIGAGLAALRDDSIQLVYATAHQYNQEKYSKPGTDCYVFSLPDALPVRS